MLGYDQEINQRIFWMNIRIVYSETVIYINY